MTNIPSDILKICELNRSFLDSLQRYMETNETASYDSLFRILEIIRHKVVLLKPKNASNIIEVDFSPPTNIIPFPTNPVDNPPA